MKKVFVSNIPIRGCVDGWVEVPDGTLPDDLNEAVRNALRDRGFQTTTHDAWSEPDLGLDLDEEALASGPDGLCGWEFVFPFGEDQR